MSDEIKSAPPFYEPRRELKRSASYSAPMAKFVDDESGTRFGYASIAEDRDNEDINELRKQLDERNAELQQAKESIKQLRMKENELLDR